MTTQPEPAPLASPDDDQHVCKPGASVYYCPTAGETESDCHGGFDVCCGRPDLHQQLVPCSTASLRRQPHAAHSWEPQPGMIPVHCEGVRDDRAVPAPPVPGLRDQIADVFRTKDGQLPAWTKRDAGPEAHVDAVMAVVQPVIDEARAEIAAIREGEEPYEDDRIVPSPGQWIWCWNRAAPVVRLSMARHIQAMREQQNRIQALARDWAEAQPLLPGQALADLANALSDNPQPVMCHNVRIGKHYIRVHGDRVPTPDEQAAIGALLDATEAALAPPVPADTPEGGAQ